MRALRWIAVAALGLYGAAAVSADAAWMLNYTDRSTNALYWDRRFRGVVAAALPLKLVRKVLDGLGGPPDPVVVVGPTLSASACVAHACLDKSFLWIDTSNGIALGASASLWGCDEGAEYGLRCELVLGSRQAASYQTIPAAGRQALLEWLNDHEIRIKAAQFIDAANKSTTLDIADFRLAERFQAPATGPSFDCHLAQSQIDRTICDNPALAKFDLEIATLYEQLREGHDTVGDRQQVRDLQQGWLARRAAVCPDAPQQVACLTAAYRHQHDVLENWLPAR